MVLGYQHQKALIQVAITYTPIRYLHEDRSLTNGNFWESTPKTHLDEIGAMYGKGINVWRFFLNGSAGLAYI